MGAANSNSTLAAASEPRQRLVELMQQMNFGRIEGLVVRDGEPVLNDPAPKVFREVKFGGDNAPRAEAGATDFALKARITELFEHFDRLRNGRIEVLTIKHGLPFGMHVEAAA
jgi:hypothetical protein